MIPQGYKHTELGIIPQEWHIETLGAICNNICSGKNKTKSEFGNYPVYGSTGIIGYADGFVYDKPTILVARVGANAGLINKVDGCFDVSDNTLIIDCKKDVSFNFLYELLQFINFNKFVFGSGQPLITAGLLKSIHIPVPPVEEQRKIAEILGVWDKAIELQARLIDKLELRKRALMQRLLTGRLRLPGFSAPWQKVHLSQIALLTKGVQYNKILLQETGLYPVINGGITPSGYADKYNAEANTITISEGGNSCGYVNYISTRFWCGGHCYRVKEKELVDKIYLYYLLKHHEPMIMQLRVGSGLPNIQIKPLQKYKLQVPSLAEQTAIAGILSTADKEIAIAKAKLAAYRTQKRGLMQQLLTGKKRVKV